MENAQSDADMDDPSMWAISYQQLMQFHADAAKEFKDEYYESKTMRDVVDRMIAPWCRRTHRSYALTLNPRGLKIDAFITHAWDEPFASFVRSIIRVFETIPSKPNLWICSFALIQGDDQVTEAALNVPLIEAPFVKALRKASSYVVVRNATTDVYTRIWCVCELMFAKKEGLVPEKTHVTGPCSDSNAPIFCLDAKATDIRDKEKIVEALLNDRFYLEVDTFVNLFRLYNTPSMTEQETTNEWRYSSVQPSYDTEALATAGNDVSQKIQYTDDGLSESEELGIVGIQLSGAHMDSCRDWEDYVLRTESNFNDLLESLLKYGELKEGNPKVKIPEIEHRRHKRGWLKHIRSHGKERAAVKLHCAVKVYKGLDECDYRRVKEICRTLAKLLETGGAKPSQLECLMIGAAWRGSLVLFLEAPTQIFDILFAMLKDSNYDVPLGIHNASICGLKPAFLLPPLQESGHLPFDKGERTADAVVWEIDTLLLLIPKPPQSLNRIVRQGEKMWPEKAEGDLNNLPQVRVFQNPALSKTRNLESETRELEAGESPNTLRSSNRVDALVDNSRNRAWRSRVEELEYRVAQINDKNTTNQEAQALLDDIERQQTTIAEAALVSMDDPRLVEYKERLQCLEQQVIAMNLSVSTTTRGDDVTERLSLYSMDSKKAAQDDTPLDSTQRMEALEVESSRNREWRTRLEALERRVAQINDKNMTNQEAQALLDDIERQQTAITEATLASKDEQSLVEYKERLQHLEQEVIAMTLRVSATTGGGVVTAGLSSYSLDSKKFESKDDINLDLTQHVEALKVDSSRNLEWRGRVEELERRVAQINYKNMSSQEAQALLDDIERQQTTIAEAAPASKDEQIMLEYKERLQRLEQQVIAMTLRVSTTTGGGVVTAGLSSYSADSKTFAAKDDINLDLTQRVEALSDSSRYREWRSHVEELERRVTQINNKKMPSQEAQALLDDIQQQQTNVIESTRVSKDEPGLKEYKERLQRLEQKVIAMTLRSSTTTVDGVVIAGYSLHSTDYIKSKIQKLESSTSAAIIERLLDELRDFTKENEGNCITIAAAGGIENIVSAMNQYVDLEGVQEAGCGALRNLAYNNNANKVRIAALGGIESIVAAMNRHVDHAGVQEFSCRALWNLAVNKDNRVKIAAAGGMERVVAAMTRHADHAGVQEAGCGALRTFAWKNNDKQVKLAAMGGIESIVSAMNRHMHHAGVQETGCGALLILAVNDDNQVKIAAAGGIECVVSAMTEHTDNWEVQIYGCRALWTLAINDYNKMVKIPAAGGIEGIVAAMKQHLDSARIQRFGCGVLGTLAEADDNKVKIAIAGGIERIVLAMNRHSDSVGVQIYGCGALWNLAKNDDNKIKISAARGIESILSAMKRYVDNEDLQRRGHGALKTLARNKDNKAKIDAMGGIP